MCTCMLLNKQKWVFQLSNGKSHYKSNTPHEDDNVFKTETRTNSFLDEDASQKLFKIRRVETK